MANLVDRPRLMGPESQTEALESQKELIDFITDLKRFGCIGQPNSEGKVIYADD